MSSVKNRPLFSCPRKYLPCVNLGSWKCLSKTWVGQTDIASETHSHRHVNIESSDRWRQCLGPPWHWVFSFWILLCAYWYPLTVVLPWCRSWHHGHCSSLDPVLPGHPPTLPEEGSGRSGPSAHRQNFTSHPVVNIPKPERVSSAFTFVYMLVCL